MMTHKILLFTIIFLVCKGLIAQDINLAKKAYFEEKYDEAKEVIDKINQDSISANELWYYRGLIYSAIASDVRGAFRDLDSLAVFKAYNAFRQVIDTNNEDNSFQDSSKLALDKLYNIILNNASNTFQKAKKTDDGKEKKRLYNEALRTSDLGQLLSSETDTLPFYISTFSALKLKKYDSYIQAMQQLAIRTGSKTQKLEYYKQLINVCKDSLDKETQNKDDKLTLEILNIALKVFPNNRDFLDLRIEINAKNKTYQQPPTDIEKKIKIDPNDANNYFNLAILYQKQDDIEKAVVNFKKCIELDPSHYDAIFHIGVIYYNKAATTLRSINDMDYTEYTKKGKETEELAKKQFKDALPFFVQLRAMRTDSIQVLNILKQLYKILGMSNKENEVAKEIKELYSSGK